MPDVVRTCGSRCPCRNFAQGRDPFAALEQVCWTRHLEATQDLNETLELLRKAGVVINDVILSKLGVND